MTHFKKFISIFCLTILITASGVQAGEIHVAAAAGDLNKVRALIEADPTLLESKDDNGNTPLHIACVTRQITVANFLIDKGANVNARNNYEFTPLQLASGGVGQNDESSEAGLANGHLNPNELAGQKISVLVTKTLGTNYDSSAFDLAKRMRGIDMVFDARLTVSDMDSLDIPFYRLAVPNKSFSAGGIEVHTIPAMSRGYGGAVGVGYLVEADGMKIFHAGFHVSSNEGSQMERYREEIDFLKPFGPIDVAILSVSGHLAADYEPYLYLIDQLSPKAVCLMGGDAMTEEYPKCAEVLRVRNIPVKYPEGGIAMGERFHYLREQK
jgi:hypothetical protein